MEAFALAVSFGIMAVLAVFLLVSFATWTPFLPSTRRRVREMVELSGIKPGERMADLGSGDGRIVMAFARAGAEAHGYELNPLLVLWSRVRIWSAGLSGKAFIHQRNFWNENLASFDVVTMYCLQRVMPGLEEKLKRELRPGARAISNTFTMPGWTPEAATDRVAIYRKSAWGK